MKSSYYKTRTIIFLALLLVYIQPAYSYLDPGTGSMLLAVIVGIVSTLLFLLRSFWYKILVAMHGVFGSKKDVSALGVSQAQSIVFYSEGSQYWNSFSPVINALIKKKIACTYLSSDEKDPGLSIDSDYVHKKYIGKGNKAYFHLNLLRADLCALSTPNLDVLQIRRSKQVKHYTHIIHAPTDLHLYKLFAFDFYDSMLLSGPHQEKSLRHLEQIRNSKKKQSYLVGCNYMDVLWQKKQNMQEEAQKEKHKDTSTVLIAPTWGRSSVLNVCGDAVLQGLADTTHNVIVRPHPQSFLVEAAMLEYYQEKFKDAKNIVWDTNPDGFQSLQDADVLISDRSGIIFDFAFIFEKPVITHNVDDEVLGMEGNDIPWRAWELDILDTLGTTVSADSIQTLSHTVDSVLRSGESYASSIRSLRDEYVHNIGSAGEKSAEVLVDIAKQVA